MKHIAIALFASGLLLVAGVSLADAPAKPKRPTLCTAGQVMTGGQKTMLVCLDGKRPRVFSKFVRVEFVDENGAARAYFLGWPSVAPKAVKVASIETM